MKADWYVKTILTVIALLLTVMALKPHLQVRTADAADGVGDRFGHVQMWAMGYILPGISEETHIVLFDKEDGSVWGYSDEALMGRKLPVYVGKLESLGGPILTKQKPKK